MNSRPSRKAVIVLSDDETRKWHAIFSRELRDYNRDAILRRCLEQAREAGSTEYVIYDAYESEVAKGQVWPAA
jgi:hypothetical protein